MTTISGTTVSGTIVPTIIYSDSLGIDYNGTSFCSIRPTDLYNPDSRVSSSPLNLVTQTQSSPFTIPLTTFGVHFNRWYAGSPNETVVPSSLTMPVVRSHDGGLRWSQLNPSSGVYSWSALDSWLSRVEARGALPIFTVFGTPTWASSRPTEIGAYGPSYPGLSAEPALMSSLGDFITALVTRYGNRITHFEVWNEPNIPTFYSGTNAKLADMVATVYAATSGVTGRKMLTPSAVGWMSPSLETYFVNMMNTVSSINALAIKDMCDIVAVHLYNNGNYTPTLISMLTRIRSAMSTVGVSAKPLWDTESNVISPDLSTFTDLTGAIKLRRHIATIAALGVQVSCQYTYDHTTMGWATRSTLFNAREQLVSELANKTFDSAFVNYRGEVIFKTSTTTLVI